MQNLDDRTPIVSDDGSPTHYFMGLLQRRGGLLQTAQDDIDSILSLNFNAGTGLDGGGTIQSAIDAGTTPPAITFDLANTAVTPGSYGDATHVGTFTVDAQGRLTAAANVLISSAVSDGDKGDITVSSSGTVWTIDAGAVTLSKIANAAASSKLVGSGASGSGASYSEITIGSGLTMTGTTLSATGSGGSVTTVSVVSANGLAGTVATATTTPAITLSTTITGVLKGNGTAISAAAAGTDYLAPAAIGSTVQAWDADLDALAALAGTDTIYRRSGAATWSAVTVGAGLSFTGGTLSGSGSGTALWDFAPPSAASFTLASADATNLTLTDDTDAGLLIDGGTPVAGSKIRWGYRTLTTKTNDWDMKVKYRQVVVTTSFSAMGIHISDSVSGRFARMAYTQSTNTIAIETWSAIGTYNASSAVWIFNRSPQWLRVAKSGSTLTWYASDEGKIWTPLLAQTDTTYLTNHADRVGIGVDYTRSSGPNNMGSIPYFSLTGTAV